MLHRAGVVPSVQFVAPPADADLVTSVDLVLDLGTARTLAVLVEAKDPRDRGGVTRADLLPLRDMSTPTRSHTGSFSSGIVFARADFGPEAVSRRSGRADAFRWPSLARLGPEAERLAALAPPADGAIGVVTPKAHLMDLTPRADVWRFAPDPKQPLARRPMLAGSLLGTLPDVAGLLPAPEAASRTLADTIRPRFSLSSTLSFAIVELLSQAIAALHAPTDASETDNRAARRLRHVVISLPLATPVAERQLLRERTEAAVDMLWAALGWGRTDIAFAPPPPTVRLGLDETLCAQLLYLFDEIADRFAGDSRAFFDMIGSSRPEFGLTPSLRLGAIDVGGGHAHSTIVTYAMGDAGLASSLFGTQRSAIGGERVLDGIVHDVLASALADAAHRAGHRTADAVVQHLIETSFVREQWLRPAALALIDALDGRMDGELAATWSTTLAALAGARRPVSPAAIAALNARDEMSLDWSALALSVRLSDVAASAQGTLAPMIAALVRPMTAAGCDAVLLSGWLARLPLVKQLVVREMPWRPDRVFVVDATTPRAWSPLSADALEGAAGKGATLLGSMLALGGGDRFGFGEFDTTSAPDLQSASRA
jgi:hypothetical protein